VAKKIFITATNTDVGKTYTSLKLIKIYSNLGYKVGVIKPIETGVVDSPLDATLLFKEVKIYNNLFHNLNINDIDWCFIQVYMKGLYEIIDPVLQKSPEIY